MLLCSMAIQVGGITMRRICKRLIYGTVLGTWSIGGPQPSAQLTKSILGKPQGIVSRGDHVLLSHYRMLIT